jgi:hypothetical protein
MWLEWEEIPHAGIVDVRICYIHSARIMANFNDFDPMDKHLLRKEYLRLIYPEDLPTLLESYKLVTDVALEIVAKQKNVLSNSPEDLDAGHLFQMTVLKNLSIAKLADPLHYTNDISNFSMRLHDPFAMSNIARSQYEAFCNFNNIYRSSKSPEEKQLKYYLWVISGLKNRQSFKAELEESVTKKERERLEIIELHEKIVQSALYQTLEEDSKENVKKAIKSKKWQIQVNSNRAFTIGWQEMMKNAGANELLDGQYTALSLNTHPSNVSVFQFGSLYSTDKVFAATLLTIKLSKWLTALFISDYCNYFADAKHTFDKGPLMSQILINSYNLMLRNESYKINSVSEMLD